MSEQANRYPLPLAPASLAALVPCSHGGCPLGVDAAAIASALRAGDHPRAYLVARGPNPFASSCGHGCHAPCESACRRRHFGAPVAIAALEAYAAGFSIPSVLASPEPCTSAHDARAVAALRGRDVDGATRAPRSGRRVAVIGAGAAGLACAHDLVLLGHSVVVFDAAREPGGLLTAALPAFRFPTASARAECAAVLAMDVEYRGSYRVEGAGVLRALLAAEFDAIFVAVGASAPRARAFPAQPAHEHVVDAMAVLAERVPLGGRVVIVGDGDLAIDAARVALRRTRSEEAAHVTAVEVVLETPFEESTIAPAMIAAAIQDGIAIHAGWRASRYLVTDHGAVSGVEVTRPGEGVSKVIACDHVVTATPRAPDATLDADLARDGKGFVAVDAATLQTSLHSVWAGGACAFGHRAIPHATADGKRAAWQIHAALTGRPVEIAVSSAWIELDDWDPSRASSALATSRLDLPTIAAPPADPFSSSALRDVQEVVREATRCFDCTVLPVIDDSCTACGKCIDTCPVGAFSLSESTPRVLVFDQEPCTRCGNCVHGCPHGSIAMARAVWEERLIYADERDARRPAIAADSARLPTPPDLGALPPMELA